MSNTRQLGAQGERLVERFLRKRGYKVLARNYRCPRGEIDLITLDGQTVVFVEVKTRQNTSLAEPEESVRLGKQRRLTQIARHWLKQHGGRDRRCRFDVVAVKLGPGEPVLRHFHDAFEPQL